MRHNRTLALLRGGLDAVRPPDHHRRVADLAVGDPADLVVEVPLRQLSRLAELADPLGHQQLRVTVEFTATVVPDAGLTDLIVPQEPVLAADS